MDRYIKMLLMKISQEYRATVTTVMFVGGDGRIKGSHTLRISRKSPGKGALLEYQTYSKRDLVSEMMAWLNRQSQ